MNPIHATLELALALSPCTCYARSLTHYLAQSEHHGDLQQTPDGDELTKV